MKVVRTTAVHDADLNEFYQKFTLSGNLEIKVARPCGFSAPYELQSPEFATYMLTDDAEKEIFGCVTFIVFDAPIDGEIKRIAYGKDLRITYQRQVIKEWSQHFAPLLDAVQAEFNIDHIFSILNMTEAQSLNAFIRPRSVKRELPRYHLYRRFQVISLHGKWPWSSPPLPHLHLQAGSEANREQLIEYIARKSALKNLSPTSTPQKVDEVLSRWRALSLDDFIIAMDSKERIVGCMAPWDQSPFQDFIPYKYDSKAHNFRQFLKFGNLFGWTRPLTKPVHRLGIEVPLHFRYLQFLHVDNPDIFETLLHAAFDHLRPTEFLSYVQMRNDIALRAPKNWISGKIPFGVYSLIRPGQEMPSFLHPSHDQLVNLEPFYL
ncbi:MAG: hypothetical protein V4736_16100 [Bdellovibrionota bacterium]